MGPRNTRPKSTYMASMAKSRSRALIQTEHHPWPGSDRLRPDKAILHAEVLSDQLTRWCCIDRLSQQRLPGPNRLICDFESRFRVADNQALVQVSGAGCGYRTTATALPVHD